MPDRHCGPAYVQAQQAFSGFSTFPAEIDPKAFVMKEYGQSLGNHFGISSAEDLLKGPVKAKYPDAVWSDGKFTTPSGKYEFRSELCAKHGHNALPVYVPGASPREPCVCLRLTPSSAFTPSSSIWTGWRTSTRTLRLHAPSTASERGIKDGIWSAYTAPWVKPGFGPD